MTGAKQQEKISCLDWGHPDLDHHTCLHCGLQSECIDEENEQRAEEEWQNHFGIIEEENSDEGINNYDGAGRRCG